MAIIKKVELEHVCPVCGSNDWLVTFRFDPGFFNPGKKPEEKIKALKEGLISLDEIGRMNIRCATSGCVNFDQYQSVCGKILDEESKTYLYNKNDYPVIQNLYREVVEIFENKDFKELESILRHELKEWSKEEETWTFKIKGPKYFLNNISNLFKIINSTEMTGGWRVYDLIINSHLEKISISSDDIDLSSPIKVSGEFDYEDGYDYNRTVATKNRYGKNGEKLKPENSSVLEL